MKRLFDLIISFFAIAVLSPVMIIIAVLIKLQNHGTVIFKQKRVGKENKEFTIYKFRSMWEDAPEIASNDLEDPDSYITPIGKFLRKTSLDELPQLFNILRGDMSLVGPRPVINDASESELLKRRTELGIYKLVPGLTGWAQINGRDDMSIDRKVFLEAQYMNRRNFLLDMRILISTFLKVFKQEGIVEGKCENEKCEMSTNENVKDVI